MVFENMSNGSYEAGSNQGSSSSSQQKVDEKKPCMSLRFYLTRHFQDLQNKMEKTTVVGYMKARFPNDADCTLFASDNDSEKFLAILQGEKDETLELFVEALEKTSQNHLASLLRGKESAIDDLQSSNCEPDSTLREGSQETEKPSSTIVSQGQKRKAETVETPANQQISHAEDRDELLVKVSLQGNTNPGSKEAHRLNEGQIIKMLNNPVLLDRLSSFLTNHTGIRLSVAGWSPGSIILHLKLATNEDRHILKNLCDTGFIGSLLKKFFEENNIIETHDLQSTNLDATILEKANGTTYIQLSLPVSTFQKDEPEEKKRKQVHLEATEESSQPGRSALNSSETDDQAITVAPICSLAGSGGGSTHDYIPEECQAALKVGKTDQDSQHQTPSSKGSYTSFPATSDQKSSAGPINLLAGSGKGSAQDDILSESHDKQYQGSSSGGSVPSSPAAHDERDSDWSRGSPVLPSEELVAGVQCNI